MNAPYVAKRPVQVELDASLVERAESLGPSLARTIEAALTAHLPHAETRHAQWLADAEAHCKITNALIEKHGFWGEEFSTL